MGIEGKEVLVDSLVGVLFDQIVLGHLANLESMLQYRSQNFQ